MMAYILILEDEISLAADWQKLLESHDHQVTCCSTVEQSLEQLSSVAYDLIIADMLIKIEGQFTNSGGLTLIGKRATGDLPPIPVIGVSGCRPNHEDFLTSPLEIAKGMGIEIALYKPISPNNLLNAVNKLLSQT